MDLGFMHWKKDLDATGGHLRRSATNFPAGPWPSLTRMRWRYETIWWNSSFPPLVVRSPGCREGTASLAGGGKRIRARNLHEVACQIPVSDGRGAAMSLSVASASGKEFAC